MNVTDAVVTNTIEQCQIILTKCREKTLEKNKKYGPSWMHFRMVSFKDQLLIKILRITNLQEGITQLVENESILDNLYELVNYTILARFKLLFSEPSTETQDFDDAVTHNLGTIHQSIGERQLELIVKKNNDYGEAWKSMHEKSLIDMIHVKLVRADQVIHSEMDIDEKCEALNEIYADSCSYAMFCIIKLEQINNQIK